MLSLMLLAATAAPPPRAADFLPADPLAPGCALEVRENGQVIESAATGLANLEDGAPVRSDTVFEAGSVSKQFIGAGIAVLADRGRLGLDDPVLKWLPELGALHEGITIRMLLNHTSGIRSWNNLAELTGRSEDSTGYDNAWVLRAAARQRRLNFAPGSEYLYSNSNFVLAAIIIERASRQELNAFFRDTFFARLGMTRSMWRTDYRTVVPRRAQAYLPNDAGGWQLDVPLNGVAGAGGLLTTVGDLQRWASALATPAPQDRGWAAMLLASGALADGTPLSYGLGIEIGRVGGLPAYSHAGSTGSYRAWFGLFPRQRLSVALLCNSGAVNTEDLGPEIAARFLPQEPAAGAQETPPGDAPRDLAGLYRNTANDTAVTVTVDNSGLRFNGGPAFVTSAADRLETRDRQRFVTVKRSDEGRVTALALSRVGNAPVQLEPAALWAPDAAALAAFAGDYASSEVEGVQSIVMAGDALAWRDPSGALHPLEPLYPDTFAAPDASWTLRFRREAGRIT
ncbi:MAG: serine hydrolase domain-containing protein, partial [Erythrobacter sp.]